MISAYQKHSVHSDSLITHCWHQKHLSSLDSDLTQGTIMLTALLNQCLLQTLHFLSVSKRGLLQPLLQTLHFLLMRRGRVRRCLPQLLLRVLVGGRCVLQLLPRVLHFLLVCCGCVLQPLPESIDLLLVRRLLDVLLSFALPAPL